MDFMGFCSHQQGRYDNPFKILPKGEASCKVAVQPCFVSAAIFKLRLLKLILSLSVHLKSIK